MTEATEGAEPPQQGRANPPRGFAVIGGWRGMGWLALGFVPAAAFMWLVLFSGIQTGSKADWFAGVSTFTAVVVALVLTARITRQVEADAAKAYEGLRRELAEAELRTRTELAAAEQRSADELAHALELHRVELDAQKELAHAQRVHLLELQQKQALAEVLRAVSAHTRMLATVWNRGAKILEIKDRAEREQAMDAIMEPLGQVVQDFWVELGNANLLIEDDRLHEVLNRVNGAAVKAVHVAEDVRTAVVDGQVPDPNPIPPVQEVMHERAADARRVALELLQTGHEDQQG